MAIMSDTGLELGGLKPPEHQRFYKYIKITQLLIFVFTVHLAA